MQISQKMSILEMFYGLAVQLKPSTWQDQNIKKITNGFTSYT